MPVFRIESILPSQIARHRAAWADLCGRTLEPNVFLEPAFAIPLVEHVKESRGFDFLVVWDADAPGRMLGLLPVRLPRLAAVGRVIGFHDKLVCLGTPLLDATHARAVFSEMLAWMARRISRPVALELTSITADGAFMRDVVGDLGIERRVDVLASHRRAILRQDAAIEGKVLSLQSAKSRKELKRQRRRLAEQGERCYVSARTPEAVANATETFLLLEQKGWKGERRTALLAKPALAAFARDMTRAMVGEGKCRIDALELDGLAVAMGIILSVDRRAYFWKTAFDEDLAPLSPGVQFTMDLTEAQLGEAGATLTDSCAVPDHSMIDRLWPDRQRIVDLAIALQSGRTLRLSAGLGLGRVRRGVRAWAKDKARRIKRAGPR